MKDPYQCPHCNHSTTRRWNLDVHIKRKHGEYSFGGSSDRYIANNHALYNQSVHLGHATVADSNAFEPMYLPQQTPIETSQYLPTPNYPPVEPNFVNPMYRHMQIRNNQSYGTSLSQHTMHKIQEAKVLLNKYPKYHTNPDGLIRLAIFNSIHADDSLLNDMLEQLRSLDSLANIKFPSYD